MAKKVILSINAGSNSVKILIYTAYQNEVPSQIAEADVSGLTAPPGATEDTKLPDINKSDIALTCHRVVHGGGYTTPRSLITIVKSCVSDTANVAFFDSQFHASIPEHIRTYPIDPNIAKKRQLSLNDLNIIALHLGSGASAYATKSGKSWDTSMELTLLAGLSGATRSRSVDPGSQQSWAEEILNKESRWKVLTGTTNFGLIVSELENNPAYKARGGRVDALVFAGGIGERSDALSKAVVAQASYLSFEIDETANQHKIENVV
ncbi:actin-like ATPase domain-containing protein [Xylariaceae sp. AK1471]|nr:actin-like ATPase domain-containing protein [Xylariaceae sp. AK1471]